MSHALSAGTDLVAATQCYRLRELRYVLNAHFYIIAEGLISVCQKHVVAATGSSPFKVGDNQRPERTMPGAAKTSAYFPLHAQPPTGTKESASPLTTPDMVRSGRVLRASVINYNIIL